MLLSGGAICARNVELHKESDGFQPDFSATFFSPTNEAFTIFSMFFWPQANISMAFGPKMAKMYIENQKWLDYIQTLRVPGGQYRYYISMNLKLFIEYALKVVIQILFYTYTH